MKVLLLLFILALIGLLDSAFLTYEHYRHIGIPCPVVLSLSDCDKVLQSSYAIFFGIPLAVVGIVHYSLLASSLSLLLVFRKEIFAKILVVLSTVGFASSLYFVFLQLVPIGAICFYCMISALTSTIIFVIVQSTFPNDRRYLVSHISHILYTHIVKRLFFQLDPLSLHECMTVIGAVFGRYTFIRKIFSFFLQYRNLTLKQKIAGITFENPIGLSAGFDYEAKLTQILPNIGFGFETVGTITNHPYDGNPKPMLGRLPKSKSLMVNKGFKNLGAKKTIEDLTPLSFSFPVGVSIGRTNALSLKTQKQSIDDIIECFTQFERSSVKHSYYELNISCPNLFGDITFYPTKNLQDLLIKVDNLKLTRPLFIKMPIEKTNKEVLEMLEVIKNHKVAGVIFGNLQKNRNDKALYPDEVVQFPVGNFSGKPCFTRSNELISLCYSKFKNRFIIIGSGGVFNAEDAYEKIKRGASLVQLITGMVYEGPQLATQINQQLTELLKKDGYSTISAAIGTQNSYSVNI